MPTFEVFQRVWGDRRDPPLITVLLVAGLAQRTTQQRLRPLP
jgi:hypothetical protein